MKKFFIFFIFCLVCFSSSCFAQTSKKEILDKAEEYFNSLKSLKAVFIQNSIYEDKTNDSNKIVGGMVYIKKPNKMRLEYEKEVPILIVADGHFLIYYDKSLDQTTHIGLDKTPAGILLKENLSFDDKRLRVTKVSQEKGVAEISVVQKQDPMAGELTLVFSQKPFELKQWKIKDAHNVLTRVMLTNVKKQVELDDDIFKIKKKRDFLGYNPSSRR